MAPSRSRRRRPRLYLRPDEVRFLVAATDRLIPEDEFPSASQAGAVDYIDLQLATDWGAGPGLYMEPPFFPEEAVAGQGYQLPYVPRELYRRAIGGLFEQLERPFWELAPEEQDAVLTALQEDRARIGDVPSATFFDLLQQNTMEGYFADPIHGGNEAMIGWRMVGFPGAHAYYTDTVNNHGMDYWRPPAGITRPASGLYGARWGQSPEPRVRGGGTR